MSLLYSTLSSVSRSSFSIFSLLASGAYELERIGWIIAAAALAHGAPFWFDALGRVSGLKKSLKRGTIAEIGTKSLEDPA